MDWKKLLSCAEEQSLDFYTLIIQEGSPVVQPPANVFDDGIADWKLALVGQFIGSAPNFSAMKKITELLWGKSSTVKVCIEIDAAFRIPNKIDVLMKDGSTVSVRVFAPWLPACCSKCRTYGHFEKACAVEAPATKVWKKKEVPEVVQFSTVSGEPSLHGVVNSMTLISDGHVAPIQDFSVGVSIDNLPNSIKKTGRDRLDTGKDIVGSTNKFAVLSDGDVPIPEGRKPRAASQGVTNILNELKAKKKENVEKSKRSSAPSKVVGSTLSLSK
ncbi:hypothetical protein V6N13_061231 [Hibiscus sabdariffa]